MTETKPPRRQAQPEVRTRLRLVILCAGLALLHSMPVSAQSAVFYAIGSGSSQADSRTQQSAVHVVYEVDAATLRVVRSVEVDKAESGMLSAPRDAIVLSDNDSSVWRLSATELKVVVHFSPAGNPSDGVDCLEHTFVHPLTGLTFFSCDTGRDTGGVLMVDTAKQSVVKALHANYPRIPIDSSHFLFDPKRKWLFLDGDGLVALDPENKVVDQISGRELGQKATPKLGELRHLRANALLPNGNLVLRGTDEHGRSLLLLYDPSSRNVQRSWVETQEFTATSQHPTPGTKSVFQSPLPLTHGPVASRDGSRLFAISDVPSRYHGDKPARGVLFDAENLAVVRRWDLPEPPRRGQESEPQCFFPAPDRRGIWYVGQSGKVYRFDDHTGDLLEEVKLPFHLINLVREP